MAHTSTWYLYIFWIWIRNNIVEAVSPYSCYPPFDRPLFVMNCVRLALTAIWNASPFSKCKLLLSRHFFFSPTIVDPRIYYTYIGLFDCSGDRYWCLCLLFSSFYRSIYGTHGTLRIVDQKKKKREFLIR